MGLDVRVPYDRNGARLCLAAPDPKEAIAETPVKLQKQPLSHTCALNSKPRGLTVDLSNGFNRETVRCKVASIGIGILRHASLNEGDLSAGAM